MDTIAPSTDTGQQDQRTPFQETLLGDGPGSRIAWSLYQQGYERGIGSGYSAGYADAIADMLGAKTEFLARVGRISSLPTRAEVEQRRAAKAAGADTRTGAELRADAAASWGLTEDTAAAAA